MNEHFLLLRGLIVALIALASIPAAANEQQRAIAECQQASRKAADKEKSNFDMVELCNLTTKSHEYWVCVHGRISAGETYIYANSRCNATLREESNNT